ncbi:MAG: Mov34/MPN/PAD-1 family protein [Proteobacteria bacterium]|nr:Mov34/MPN/PAD-1 family protein [Pseudomonadota bacterium]
MIVEFIPFGESYADLSPENVRLNASKKILKFCKESKEFEVIELRHLTRNDEISDLIIVECFNDQVPSRNQYGIKVRERLALVFTPETLPEVRALRADFPTLPHMNHVLPGEPASLCLYADTWQSLERTWTPQKHLQRILWWFTESAKGTLHRDDQSLEPLYFESPFEIVLPPDFDEKSEDPNLVLIPQAIRIERSPLNFKVVRCFFQDKRSLTPQETSKNKVLKVPLIGVPSGQYRTAGTLLVPQKRHENKRPPNFTILTVTIPSIVHGIIEQYPRTLGELHDQMNARGGTILDKLKNIIKEKASGGIAHEDSSECLLILSMQLQRSVDSPPENNYKQAFEIVSDLAGLGEKMGVLPAGHDGKWYPIEIIGGGRTENKEDWREIKIWPVDVKLAVTRDLARVASDVDLQTSDFKGVLAGVGALGGSLAEMWSKEHWGAWSFIDPDMVKSHNIIRHIAKNFHVGIFKTDVVKDMVEFNYQDEYYHAVSIPRSANDFSSEAVKEAISKADFIVDATTTIEIPRDLSQREVVPRSVSVFLTPSGRGSALLMESADRSLRLDALEAQYYRAIINEEWGKDHLEGYKGRIRVGAGCRDVSTIISYETIQFHAAMLARQVRLLRDESAAHIRVWSGDFERGALAAYEIPVYESDCFKCGDWHVIVDTVLREKLCKLRMSYLPNETGGVILGYIDQKLRHIYVVDVLNAPADSDSDRTGFTRGVEGLKAALDEVARRTANIVGYIGEWHSHPAFTSAYPSSIDRTLIKQLADTLELDGQPALMIIVGRTGDVSVSVKEAGSHEQACELSS